jgi:quercetin dioxygenase-like cupin family protein
MPKIAGSSGMAEQEGSDPAGAATAAAVPEVQVDNERTRVTQWRFAPGAATGYHRHEFDYVIVPATTGRLRIVGPDGKESLSDLQAGVSYFRNAGVEHDVINASDGEFVFVEVEIK